MTGNGSTGLNKTAAAVMLYSAACLAFIPINNAQADTFAPTLNELNKWNCPTYQGSDCLVFSTAQPTESQPAKMIKVRVETDAEKPYLRAGLDDHLIFFSENLNVTSPKAFHEILERCQFRTKNDYCAIKATIVLDVIEKIESWSLHRYDVAK